MPEECEEGERNGQKRLILDQNWKLILPGKELAMADDAKIQNSVVVVVIVI